MEVKAPEIDAKTAAQIVLKAWREYDQKKADEYQEYCDKGGRRYPGWQPYFDLDWVMKLAGEKT